MKRTVSKLLFLTNYLMIIFYMCLNINEKQSSIISSAPLLISSLMLIDITYISSCNIRESKVMNLFCGLLALDSWYMILSFEETLPKQTILTILHPVICYFSIKFALMFLFQRNGYKFKKSTDVLLLLTCIGSLSGIIISDRIFAFMYEFQLLSGWLCILFILIYHRKRIAFVLRSEGKCLLLSASLTAVFFIIYYFATLHVKNHIANFGVYLTMLLFLISIHGIMVKENAGEPLSTVFTKKQTALILLLFLSVSVLITVFTKGGEKQLFITINTVFAFIYICNIVLSRSLIKGKNRIINDSKYNEALKRLRQEEALKSEFANFLHDDVLQDLLSIKNMAAKAHRPDIQDLITETLDNMNNHIRRQMQDYHPVMLSNLTAKENYQNLIEAVSQSFPERNIIVTFDCSDILFLVEPYNVLIYRFLKELLTNVYKHSDGNRAWIMLTQEEGIIELCVRDNGSARIDSLLLSDSTAHKGIAAITERVNVMEGTVNFSDNAPNGICVQITLPMKGDDSYQYFIS